MNYDDFLIYSAINEFNTENNIPDSVKNAAKSVADKISNSKIINDVQAQYKDKSFGQIIKEVYKTIKNSGVGEFAGEIGSGLTEKMKRVIRFLAAKTGEYSVIGLLGVSILDYITPFGLLDSFFGKIELRLGIAIIISLVIYILARKKK